MGLIRFRLVHWILLAVLSCGFALASPQLRLTTSAVGPVSIAAGSNGPQQKVEAFNAGDGALALAASTTDSWLAPAVGALAPCTLPQTGNCFPIDIALNTAALAQGSYTGLVTVSDPNAWDAPQTITVTVLIGGGVPDAVSLFVPNGGADERTFTTTNLLQANVSTQTGGDWLSLSLEGDGTFAFRTSFPYHLQGRHLPGLADGTYNGSLNVTGSNFPPDVKNVPVTMRVTSEPIGAVSISYPAPLPLTNQFPNTVALHAAQGATSPKGWIVVSNRGQGTLSISGVQVATTSGGDWLTAAKLEGYDIVEVTGNIAGLAPGVYRGTVTIASNAVNGPFEVPVVLRVVPAGPALADFGGAVNNALYDTPIGQGGIVALFGGLLSLQDHVHGMTIPLAPELGGAKVYVNGTEAKLYDSYYGQINFQMPFEVQPGEASIQVVRDGVLGNVITVPVAARAPRILLLGIGQYGIFVNVSQGNTYPIPPTPGIPSQRAKAGDVLVGYGIGFGQTNPPLTTGAAATVASNIEPKPTAYFGGGFQGGIQVVPDYVGITPDPNLVGLYQFNVVVPQVPNKGDHVLFRLLGPGFESNTVELAIE